MKKLRGANAGHLNMGPGIFASSYRTTALGHADRIEAAAGEICVQTDSGDAYSFARYLVGTPAEVLPELNPELRAWVEGKLITSGVISPDASPVVRLAHALNIKPESLAGAAKSADVIIS